MKFLWSLILISMFSCEQVQQSVTDEQESAESNQEFTSTVASCPKADIEEDLRSPKTINEVTDLINALPKPLELPCFLKSLKRPLFMNITASRLSAQPADGEASPRIFLFSERLILSVVPSGRGSPYLELSEMYGDTNSIKAELEFPIEEEIEYRTGFDAINTGGRTSCSACHNGETRDPRFPDYEVYLSTAIKPNRNLEFDDFKMEFYNCELQSSPDKRCQMINAIFKQGEVYPADFPTTMPTWFETF